MHPIHVILVHFPSALYPFSFVLEGMGRYFDYEPFSHSAFFTLVGGFGFSCLAIVFGVLDFYKLNQQHNGWKTASYHAVLNILWFIGFAVLLKLRFNVFVAEGLPSFGFIVFLGVLNFGMFVSNYLGGELVFRYKIGVQDSNL